MLKSKVAAHYTMREMHGDFPEAEAEGRAPVVEVVDLRTSDSSDDEPFGFPQMLPPPTSNTHRSQPVALRTRSLQPQVTWRQILAAATPPSRGHGTRQPWRPWAWWPWQLDARGKVERCVSFFEDWASRGVGATIGHSA